jgi:hypothetical protein
MCEYVIIATATFSERLHNHTLHTISAEDSNLKFPMDQPHETYCIPVGWGLLVKTWLPKDDLLHATGDRLIQQLQRGSTVQE